MNDLSQFEQEPEPRKPQEVPSLIILGVITISVLALAVSVGLYLGGF